MRRKLTRNEDRYLREEKLPTYGKVENTVSAGKKGSKGLRCLRLE